ncbi:hypothetical protein L914_07541 [Phytophthora nicotianae]|uniref:Uncharacterized protein n=1 Tax=Phytophthora nicotianae TaxID=4792 RepID=W2NGX6_PHYNI|nr:hypothetical protein L914_07541 [Phytophthora nicotianae]
MSSEPSSLSKKTANLETQSPTGKAASGRGDPRARTEETEHPVRAKNQPKPMDHYWRSVSSLRRRLPISLATGEHGGDDEAPGDATEP